MSLPNLASLQLRSKAQVPTGAGTRGNPNDDQKQRIFRENVQHAWDDRPEYSDPAWERDYLQGVTDTLQGWVEDLENRHYWNDRERGISQLQNEFLFFKNEHEGDFVGILAVYYRRLGVMRALADILRDEQVDDATRRSVLKCLHTILVDENAQSTGRTLLWHLMDLEPSIVPVLLDCIGRLWNAGVAAVVVPLAVDSLLDATETAVTHALHILYEIVDGGNNFNIPRQRDDSGNADAAAYFADTLTGSMKGGRFVPPPWLPFPSESDNDSAAPTQVVCCEPSGKALKELIAQESTAIPLLMKIVESCPAQESADPIHARAQYAVSILRTLLEDHTDSWPSMITHKIPERLCDLIPFLSGNFNVVDLIFVLVGRFAKAVAQNGVKVILPDDQPTFYRAQNAAAPLSDADALAAATTALASAALDPMRSEFAALLRPKITQHLIPLLLQSGLTLGVTWSILSDQLLGLLLTMASVGSEFRDEIIKTDAGVHAIGTFAVTHKTEMAVRIVGLIAHNNKNQATLTRLRLVRPNEFCIAGGLLDNLTLSRVIRVDSRSFVGNRNTWKENFLRETCMYLLEDEEVLAMVTQMEAEPREKLVTHYRVLVCANAPVLMQYLECEPEFYEPALTALAGIGYNWEALAIRINNSSRSVAPRYPNYWNPVAEILHKDNVLYLASTQTYTRRAQSGQAASMLLNRLMHAHGDLLYAHKRGEALSEQQKDELAKLHNQYGSVLAELRSAFSHNALYKKTIEDGVDLLYVLFNFPSLDNPTYALVRDGFEKRRGNPSLDNPAFALQRDDSEDRKRKRVEEGVELAKTNGAASEFAAFLNLALV